MTAKRGKLLAVGAVLTVIGAVALYDSRRMSRITVENSDVHRTAQGLISLAYAIKWYSMEDESFPTSGARSLYEAVAGTEWMSAHQEGALPDGTAHVYRDAWGNPIRYVRLRDEPYGSFILASDGPNGQGEEKGGDDITLKVEHSFRGWTAKLSGVEGTSEVAIDPLDEIARKKKCSPALRKIRGWAYPEEKPKDGDAPDAAPKTPSSPAPEGVEGPGQDAP